MASKFLSNEAIPYFFSNKRIADSTQYIKYIKIMKNALMSPDKFYSLSF